MEKCTFTPTSMETALSHHTIKAKCYTASQRNNRQTNLAEEFPGWRQRRPRISNRCSLQSGEYVNYNMYDNQIYAFGQGPSKTTVNAPDIGATTATPITITGSVTDISAGTTQAQQAADFPNGVPCVSDASQSQWMEYVYMQQPEPTNVTGVPVTLYVLDSNNNYRLNRHNNNERPRRHYSLHLDTRHHRQLHPHPQLSQAQIHTMDHPLHPQHSTPALQHQQPHQQQHH